MLQPRLDKAINKVLFFINTLKAKRFSIKDVLELTNEIRNKSSKKPRIFLDGNQNYSQISHKVNVIISPKYYWVRKATFPITRASRVLKIAKSFFDDFLTEGEYKYKVIKISNNPVQNDFFIFAYQEEKIIQAIKDTNLDFSYVEKVFFAQLEMSSKSPIDVGNDEVLFFDKDILIKIPTCILEEDTDIISLQEIMQNIKTSRNHIPMPRSTTSTQTGSLSLISAVLSFIMILYFIEFIFIKNDLTKLLKEKEQVAKKHKLPRSSLQLNSIINSLEKKKNESVSSRQNIQDILSLELKKGDYIKKLHFDNRGFSLILNLKSKDDSSYYTDYLEKSFVVTKAKVDILDDKIIMKIRGKK